MKILVTMRKTGDKEEKGGVEDTYNVDAEEEEDCDVDTGVDDDDDKN